MNSVFEHVLKLLLYELPKTCNFNILEFLPFEFSFQLVEIKFTEI